ncbi:hypothetical protein [Paenibacillus montanisoli]|uniref:Uncharacterized protein n=1 Tax=Paenibacillus montanisoli TaxID=2081970 RepID=A0A328U8G4_9BACL|nr:hypothetical protein [Paenibacillus montanisoli]RAP77245.1 hypothetical protein DL346_01715 [Paenibacillus montanisoli]
MSESFEMIISQYEKLTDAEKIQVITVLSKHMDKPIQISISGLSLLNTDEIEIIKNTLNGIILTKENVPDIREAYERLRGTDLPRNISFGPRHD